jgi:glucokinase
MAIVAELYFGIDFGGTNVKLGVVDENGTVLARDSVPSLIEQGPDDLLKRIAAACETLAGRHHFDRSKFRAAGIGSPGPIDLEAGTIVTACNLPKSFDNFPMRDCLSKLLSLPTAFDNDANVACWGEYWLGGMGEITDMVLFTLGTGIGGGVICGGELIHGCTGNAAELGHIIVHPGGRKCTCGQLGCLETYASATHIAAIAGEALNQGHPSPMADFRRQHGRLTSKEIFDFAGRGDPLADKVVDGAAEALGLALVSLRHITEPARAVLAGGVIQAGEILAQRVRKFYDRSMWTQHPEPMDIRLATLGNDAGIIGAAGIAVHAVKKGVL